MDVRLDDDAMKALILKAVFMPYMLTRDGTPLVDHVFANMKNLLPAT